MAESVPGGDVSRWRRRAITLAVVAVLAVAAAALEAASRIESPQQAAARVLPPSPSVITAAVQRTVLSETVYGQGRVSVGHTVDVRGAGAAPAGDIAVVTAMPLRTGEKVYAGQVLAEVSGRPIIALRGKLPAYRDLTPGDSGPDVLQLQQALAGLGYSITDAPGSFGSSTKAAVAALYARLGYSAPTTGQTSSGSPASGSGSPSRSAKQEVYLPRGEVQYVSVLPARVASIQAGVGSSATGTVLTLAKGGLRVTGSLDAVNGDLVRTGMAASLALQGSGQSLAAKVTSVGALAVNSSTGAYYPIGLSGVDTLPASWARQQVTITVAVQATKGPVLTVPVAAVYSKAGGTTYVLAYADGRQRAVPVTAGISVGGVVQVSGRLAPGEAVVVGQSGR